MFLLLTGMRVGESKRLQWNHIDFESRILTVPRELTKSDREHLLPLSDFLLALLIEWLSQRLAADPNNVNLQNYAEHFNQSTWRLRIEAHMSGSANPAFQQRIGNQTFQVVVHGDSLASNQEFVRTQGDALSPNGGNHSGQYYASSDVDAARTYAASQNRQNPSLMGIAIPAELMSSAWARELCQFQLNGRTETHPRIYLDRLGDGSTQTIIHPSAFPELSRRGYFFIVP